MADCSAGGERNAAPGGANEATAISQPDAGSAAGLARADPLRPLGADADLVEGLGNNN